jgi:hypothetical protein
MSHEQHAVHAHHEVPVIEQVKLSCLLCEADVFGAAGRAYCRECNITFPIPKPTRKQLLSVFLLKFYMSKNSPFYHRAGCKYLRNVNPENLIETTEPVGKPCLCVR